MVALGVRGAAKSEAAIRAATTKATVVKKPNTFCIRVRELYIVGLIETPIFGGRRNLDSGRPHKCEVGKVVACL